MKSRLLIALLALSLAVLLSFVRQASAAPAEVIKCRGGGNIQLGYDSVSGAWLRFERASGGYLTQELLPGECSLPDRAISVDEPSSLNQVGVGNVNIQWGAGVEAFGYSPLAPWMRSLTLGDDRYVSFNVTQNTETFLITSFQMNVRD